MGIRIFFILFVVISSAFAAQMPGGITDSEKDANSEVQGFMQSNSKEIKTKATALLATSGDSNSNTPNNLFDAETPKAISYKTQIVAGTNYFIKTRLGNHIFHVRLYRDLQGNLSVTKVIGPKAESDPIKYF